MNCWKLLLLLWLLTTTVKSSVKPSPHVVQLVDDTVLSSTVYPQTHHSDKIFTTVSAHYLDGNRLYFCPVTWKALKWNKRIIWISSKLQNKSVKMKNGNRSTRSVIKIYHWNMGNKLWQNKRDEIEALIIDKSPDLFFISEANLMETLPDHERHIAGYVLHLPLTMSIHNCARIVLLAKEGIEVKIHKEMMHTDVAVIWAGIQSSGRSYMKVGGIYRQHQMLLKQKPNPTKTDCAQLDRWNKFLMG